MAGDGLGAGAQRDDALEVLGLVLVVGDLAAVAVELVLARAPAGGVPLGDDAMHAVGREEAVVDALPQAVRVDRVAEVAVGVAVVVAQRRGGHAELVGGLEVLEDLAPVALVAGAAAVALVDDDQVEEVGREFPVQAGAALVLGDGLVDGEVHLAALDDLAGLDLAAGVAEGGEESCPWGRRPGCCGRRGRGCGAGGARPCGSSGWTRASSRSGSHGGLAGAGGHGEQDAALPCRMASTDAVDGDLLVVARRLADRVIEGREQADRPGGRSGQLLAW